MYNFVNLHINTNLKIFFAELKKFSFSGSRLTGWRGAVQFILAEDLNALIYNTA